jgi:hypothetical protein
MRMMWLAVCVTDGGKEETLVEVGAGLRVPAMQEYLRGKVG